MTYRVLKEGLCGQFHGVRCGTLHVSISSEQEIRDWFVHLEAYSKVGEDVKDVDLGWEIRKASTSLTFKPEGSQNYSRHCSLSTF